MSKPALARYRTLTWPAYNRSLRDRGSLTVCLDLGMAWHTAPSGKRGRQQTFSDAAIQTCLMIKALFGLPLRQVSRRGASGSSPPANGFVASLLELAGLGWPVPDFSTLCRRQKTLAVRLPYRGSRGPLHLLVDSTGIKVRVEGEWHAREHGGTKRRVWRKVHLDTSDNLSISPGGEGFGRQVRRLVRFRPGLAGQKRGSRRDAGQAG
ncbi:IS5 family transposase, partial [Jannaschia formosa]|uniref:IS5 family transposase n=1 Tax=Jannaschia formosa TaxID=2259592 RepID=UPI001FD822A0